jgi:NAD(P)-dependent dehydrogenase (short-subunit alcohol dehydrogenase family)
MTTPPFRLDEKVALVTGGGTGRGSAPAFAGAGARVAVGGRGMNRG